MAENRVRNRVHVRSTCPSEMKGAVALHEGVRLWYIHTSPAALTPVGVAATQVIARVRALSQLCPVHFVSIEGEPEERNWDSLFPVPGATACTVSAAGPLGHACLLLPGNRPVRTVRDMVLATPPGPVDILHCRSHWSALAGCEVVRALRARGRRAALVYDMEGAAGEEERYAALMTGARGLRSRVREQMLRGLESRGLRIADHVICVSENMKAFIGTAYNIQPSRVSVVQSTADARLFYHDPDAGSAARGALGIPQASPVIMYNGSFAPYQRPDVFLGFFAKVLRANPQAILLIVSRQEQRAIELTSEAGLPSDGVRVTSAPYDEMRRYLNAADWGLCLRDDDIVNRVASPTKVAEYLCCGVPVVVTPWAGDYGSLVADNGLGVLLDASADDARAVEAVSSLSTGDHKKRCAQWASANLTHQSALATYGRVYSELACIR